MMNKQALEYKDNTYSSCFGIRFHKIVHTSCSSKAISNLYKGVFILLYLFIRCSRYFNLFKKSKKLSSIAISLYNAHQYGFPILNSRNLQWVDSQCKKHQICDSEKIILGFSGVFKPKKEKIFINKIALFEKSVFLGLTFFLSVNFILMIIYLILILISHEITISKITSILAFLPTYTVICFGLIIIMKGSHWDSHHLVQKYFLKEKIS